MPSVDNFPFCFAAGVCFLRHLLQQHGVAAQLIEIQGSAKANEPTILSL